MEKQVDGRVKRKTLGRHGNLTVEQARKEAQKFLGVLSITVRLRHHTATILCSFF
ncbi:hypothetical protein [Marinobacter sp.]|uniref:hypothetical protein n=1 Tax=Marinobacter sp. TaxID=50741 RepID=UPI00338D7634